MPINRVVVDASPLICLFKSGLEELFPAMFNDIVVPEAVIKEVTAKGEVDFTAQTLVSLPWIRRLGDASADPRVAAWDLGNGESAVLSFALRNPEYWAILDDPEARRCALSLQCHCIGTIGMIVLAKKRGFVQSVRGTLKKLQDAGFWLSETFLNEICKKVGEE
jgi:predicted nucleic acid-binding protein